MSYVGMCGSYAAHKYFKIILYVFHREVLKINLSIQTYICMYIHIYGYNHVIYSTKASLSIQRLLKDNDLFCCSFNDFN